MHVLLPQVHENFHKGDHEPSKSEIILKIIFALIYLIMVFLITVTLYKAASTHPGTTHSGKLMFNNTNIAEEWDIKKDVMYVFRSPKATGNYFGTFPNISENQKGMNSF